MKFLTTRPTSIKFYIALNFPNLIRMFFSYKTGKRKKITMDLKNLLHMWKEFQNHRLKMANSFPCSATFSYKRTIFHGHLSFISSPEGRHIVFSEGSLRYSVLLNEIMGTSPEGSALRITLSEGRFIVISFPTEEIRSAANKEFEVFEREEFGVTPPSSESNESE